MDLPTQENVKTIKVVTYFNGAFVGIPYEMRQGQSPRDIKEEYRHSERTGAWIWLGGPGWYGSMTPAQRTMAVAAVPRDVAWYEWCWVNV